MQTSRHCWMQSCHSVAVDPYKESSASISAPGQAEWERELTFRLFRLISVFGYMHANDEIAKRPAITISGVKIMNLSKKQNYTHVLGFAALATTLVWATSLAGVAQADRTIRLEAGTVLPVRLNDTLSSKEAHKGDSFTATLRTDDASENYQGLPTGTKIEGVVQLARPQKDKDPGVLDVSFQRLRMPDGRSYAIDGSLIGLDNKSVERRSDGRLVAKPSHKNDRLTYVGYGAGAGLIVGLLTKHALEDTVIGGGLGYLFGALQKGHSDARDVVLKPGTEMGVRLDRQVSVTGYSDNYRDDNAKYHRYTGDGDNNDTRIDNGNRFHEDRTDIGVMVGDNNVRFASTARPTLVRSVVMVPLFPVLTAAHVPYNYRTAQSTITATGPTNSVRMTVGSRIMIVNGDRRVRLEEPVQKLNGTIYVPMKALELATGQEVSYDSGSRTVLLNPVDR
jgi:hypothetical protein